MRARPRGCGDRRSSFRERTSGSARRQGTTQGRGHGRSPSGKEASDILDRLDLLAEAEAARFAPSLRSRGIDPGRRTPGGPAARRSARPRFRSHAVEQDANDLDADDELLKWILLAYPDRVVKRRGTQGTGVMVGGRGVCLGPESVVRDAELFVAIDARERSPRRVLEAQVNLASMVRLEWLEELFPDHLRRERSTRYDESRRRVVSTTQLWYHDLLLREDVTCEHRARTGSARTWPRPSASSGELLPENTRTRPNGWRELEFVSARYPESNWPDFDDHVLREILETVCHGKSRLEEIERTDLVPFLQGRLTPVQNRELQRECTPVTFAAERDDRRGWLTNPGGRRSWPCVFKNYSAGPKRRGWPGAACLFCCTSSVRTIAPSRSPTT